LLSSKLSNRPTISRQSASIGNGSVACSLRVSSARARARAIAPPGNVSSGTASIMSITATPASAST